MSELEHVFAGRWLWSTRRWAPVRFHRGDYLGDPAVPLATAVSELVRRETGRGVSGPIRLLTNLRFWGYCFNPISLYFCFDAADQCVETIVAEVTNTPWLERQNYVLPVKIAAGDVPQYRVSFKKQLHVSPFLPLALDYALTIIGPGARLTVQLDVLEPDGSTIVDATLNLTRQPITTRSLAWAWLRFPAMTWVVWLAIHWEALKLWWKGVSVFAHPRHSKSTAAPP